MLEANRAPLSAEMSLHTRGVLSSSVDAPRSAWHGSAWELLILPTARLSDAKLYIGSPWKKALGVVLMMKIVDFAVLRL